MGKTRFIHEEVGFGGEKERQGARKERLPVEPAMTERGRNDWKGQASRRQIRRSDGRPGDQRAGREEREIAGRAGNDGKGGKRQ